MEVRQTSRDLIGARVYRSLEAQVLIGGVISLPSMTKPKLIYFDAPVSRGEECRLALHLAGVDFDDVRIKPAAWPTMKEQTPYGSLPVLELPDRPPLAHSNAILVMIGRRHGLHPSDHFEAASHEGMMQHVEDLRGVVGPTIHMEDAEKKALAGDVKASWGDQMRSYVLNPYQMVKDLRTEHEVGNTSAVFDGEIDDFIDAGIRWRTDNRNAAK